jgi:glycosyltransferase involved in cell wall biosynthesis
MTNQADWFFAYTVGGAEYVTSNGFPSARVTVLNNSIDSGAIVEAMRSTSAADLAAFRNAYSLDGRTVLAFIGGLDKSKRIEFLIRAFTMMTAERSDLSLVVAGEGAQRSSINSAHEAISMIGRAGPREKALLGRTALVLLCPGRVGLVAVDSFAIGLPIVTTDWPFHAPEFEYLTNNGNALITPNTEREYADETLALLEDRDRLARLARRCFASLPDYPLNATVQSFADGIERALTR